MKSSLEIWDMAQGKPRVVLQTDKLIEAPNWSHCETHLLVNGDGRLFRVPLAAPKLVEVDTGEIGRLNNDHGISSDGQRLAISAHHGGRGSEIYLLPAAGRKGYPRGFKLVARMVAGRKDTGLCPVRTGFQPGCMSRPLERGGGKVARIAPDRDVDLWSCGFGCKMFGRQSDNPDPQEFVPFDRRGHDRAGLRAERSHQNRDLTRDQTKKTPQKPHEDTDPSIGHQVERCRIADRQSSLGDVDRYVLNGRLVDQRLHEVVHVPGPFPAVFLLDRPSVSRDHGVRPAATATRGVAAGKGAARTCRKGPGRSAEIRALHRSALCARLAEKNRPLRLVAILHQCSGLPIFRPRPGSGVPGKGADERC